MISHHDHKANMTEGAFSLLFCKSLHIQADGESHARVAGSTLILLCGLQACLHVWLVRLLSALLTQDGVIPQDADMIRYMRSCVDSVN